MASKDPTVHAALVPHLIGLTDLDDGTDAEQRAAGPISEICRLLDIDVLYTVLSNDEGWVKAGFGVEGALGRFTITRPTGIIRHILSKKTRMLQAQLTGRTAFHRYQDGWPGRETSSFLAIPLRRQGSIEGVLVLLRGPRQAPFDLDGFDLGELIGEAIMVRAATARTINRLTLLTRTDEATGLPNERAARETLDREVERARRLGESFSIARIVVGGLDRQSETSEAYRGDAILARLAKLVAGSIRGSDLLARLSTDQLLLVLPDTSRDGMTRLVVRIDGAIRNDSDRLLRRFHVTHSFAGALYPVDGVDAASLLSGLRPIDPASVDQTPAEGCGELKKKKAA